MAEDKLKTASVLAFERKLCPSDGLMYSCAWAERSHREAWKPLRLREKAVRGTISNRLSSKDAQDALKLDAKIDKPNLQRVDSAYLPMDRDTLAVEFSLRILGKVGHPAACNSTEYARALAAIVDEYVREHGFEELSSRYAENLANGRFLWRNRIGAESVEVVVKHIDNLHEKEVGTFDSHAFDLRSFNQGTATAPLAKLIKRALESSESTLLKIVAFARVGAGQEVFPSQELVLDQGTDKEGRKSKFLYSVEDQAAMHSQKLGNALRTIDTWYPAADEFGPIAIEPYGSVTSRGRAFRQPKEKIDFYTLLDNWVLRGRAPVEAVQKHYIMATIIRGGVFGEKSD